MDKTDIAHLASLARIRLEEAELEKFAAQLPAIVDYVSAIKSLTVDVETEPDPGVRPNVFREDVVTTESEQFTEAIIQQMPQRDGRFLAVKKILHTED